MPITVNYNPDIELLGQMSYDTGQGVAALRERQRQDMLRAAAQQRMDALQQSELARFDRYNFADMDWERQAQQQAQQQYENERQRQQQQMQFEQEQQRLGEQSRQSYELDAQRLQGEQLGRVDEAQLRQQTRQYYLENIEQKRRHDEAAQEQWRKEQEIKYGGTWELDDTAKQQKQAELNAVQQQRGSLYEQDYEEFVRRIEDKYRGLEKFVPKQKTFQEEVQELSYTDDKGNIWYKNPADGSIRLEVAKPDNSKNEEMENRKWIAEQLAKMEPGPIEQPEEFKARLAAQKLMLEQTVGLSEPVPTGGNTPPPAKTGTEAPPPEPEQEPKPKLSEMSPAQILEIEKAFPPEQIEQIASLEMALRQATTEGDYMAQTRIMMQLESIYRQNGYEI